MSNWFSGDVDANGVRIHYYRTGGEKPPLVLSHGATDSGRCWTRVARDLESDYDVIMPTNCTEPSCEAATHKQIHTHAPTKEWAGHNS
jgi:hypothetical protein